MTRTKSKPPRVEPNREPWATIAVLGPHSFLVEWGIGGQRRDYTSRLTIRGARRLATRQIARMTKRADRITAAEAALG